MVIDRETRMADCVFADWPNEFDEVEGLCFERCRFADAALKDIATIRATFDRCDFTGASMNSPTTEP